MSIDNVQDTTPRIQYSATAAQTEFTVPFAFFADADLVVDVDGVTQTLTTDYTVSGAGDDNGGTVTFTSGQSEDAVVTIYRDTAIERLTDFQQNGPWSSATFNDELDRITVWMQELEARLGRALRLPRTSTADSDDIELSPISSWLSKFVRINSSGVPEPASLTDDVVALSAETIGDVLYPRTQAEIDAGVTPSDFSHPESHAFRYMTSAQQSDVIGNTGSVDVRAALQATVDVAVQGGNHPEWPPGTYLIESTPSSDSHANGVVVPFSSQNSLTENVWIRTGGRSTVIKAGSNDMICLRWSASNCICDGMAFDVNGQTGCVAVAIVPEDMTQTTTRVDQKHNILGALWMSGAFDDGLWMRCGPDVGGADSGCWYNYIFAVHAQKCIRGVHLDSPTNAGGSQVNRNHFFLIRAGETGCNTGLEITSGATNHFYGFNGEGIASGTSPNTTPTAIKIIQTDPVSGGDNNQNKFYGGSMEANTRDLDIANGLTEIHGLDYDSDKSVFSNGAPKFSLSGDPSESPVVIPGMKYGEGLSGFPSTYWGMSKPIYDYDGVTETSRQDRTITTSNTTNTTSISSEAAWWDKFNDIVEFTFRFQFQASAGATAIGVDLPVNAHASYIAPTTENTWFTATVYDGTVREQVAVYFDDADASRVYVTATSGGWATGGASNQIWLTIRYRAA